MDNMHYFQAKVQYAILNISKIYDIMHNRISNIHFIRMGKQSPDDKAR